MVHVHVLTIYYYLINHGIVSAYLDIALMFIKQIPMP